jgi:tetratricopeptide (TPR) repeat protein
MILTLAVAGVMFWLAFDGGTYRLESRNAFAIAVWWMLLIALGLGLWPAARVPRAAQVTGGSLAAFALLTGASILWAESAEKAFIEFNRAALYLGVFLVAVLAATRATAGRWADGLAIAIAGVGVLALASRFFPDVLPAGDVPRFLPATYTRLSYPVNYWNGLAILLGIGTPLLLRAAVLSERAFWRGLAVAPIPVFAAVTFLASSRGGFAVALTGAIGFLVLTARRWTAAGAVAIAALGSAASIGVLLTHDAVVNGPFDSDPAVSQGRTAALLVALICAAVGLIYGAASRYAAGRFEIRPLIGRLATALVVVAALAGIAASNPVERFETFKAPPGELRGAESDFIKAHLLSGNGSGRWQFWGAALDEFETSPLWGRGAGSYEAWWAQHGSIPAFVRDAHSLYLETLGELGLLGFVLLVGAFSVGIASGVMRLRRAGDDRTTIAALTAAFLAFAVGAGIDWMWELTAVSVVGIACLGFVTGPATTVLARPRVARRDERPVPRRRFAVGVAALVLGWLVICAEAIPLLSQIKVNDSQEAVARGDGDDAVSDALAAWALQPWAASPYLQLALIHEQMGELPAARDWIREAIDRDSEDWRLWLVAARIETKAGSSEGAVRSLRRAAELNPRSPLFAEIE